jgi:hypothetical protein
MSGELAADLRRAGAQWWWLQHRESMEVWLGARLSLGLPPVNTPVEGGVYADDISSEAIECAEALGL